MNRRGNLSKTVFGARSSTLQLAFTLALVGCDDRLDSSIVDAGMDAHVQLDAQVLVDGQTKDAEIVVDAYAGPCWSPATPGLFVDGSVPSVPGCTCVVTGENATGYCLQGQGPVSCGPRLQGTVGEFNRVGTLSTWQFVSSSPYRCIVIPLGDHGSCFARDSAAVLEPGYEITDLSSPDGGFGRGVCRRAIEISSDNCTRAGYRVLDESTSGCDRVAFVNDGDGGRRSCCK